MSELVTLETKSLVTREQIEEEVRFAAEVAAKGVAESTAQTYASAWKQWDNFAQARGWTALPADARTIAVYVGAMVKEGKSVGQIEKTIAAIKRQHVQAGLDSPTTASIVQSAVAGARRSLAGKSKKKARALSIEEVRMMSRACDPTTEVGRRDRALLLIGVSLGLRSDSLVRLDAQDCQPVEGGYDVTLRRSKTDQEGGGVVLALGHAPEAVLDAPDALTALLGDRSAGALFTPARGVKANRLTSDSVTRIVRRLARAAGVSERGLSSHSLRSTFVTLAYAAGINEAEISRVSGHTSLLTLRSYDRSSRWNSPASAAIWKS